MLGYKLNKSERLEQSYIYTANTILNLSQENKSKVICVTSSLDNKNDKPLIVKNIYKKLIDQKKRVLLLNADKYMKDFSTLDGEDINKFSYEKLREKLQNKLENYDLILLNTAPVRLFADAVEYARISDGVVLIERYLHTRYKSYEETLLKLKQNDVKIFGVVTYR